MDSEREAKEVGPVGSLFLTPEELDVIRGIRARGGSVTVYSPEELRGEFYQLMVIVGDVEAVLVDGILGSVEECLALAAKLYVDGDYDHEEDGAHWICVRPGASPEDMLEIGDFSGGAMDDAMGEYELRCNDDR